MRPSSSGLRADRSYRLIHQRTGVVLASQVRIAASAWSRMRGLLGLSSLPATDALVLPWCRSIHTVGMQFAIDVIFVDQGWRAVAVRLDVRPGQILMPVWSAWGVVELASGVLTGTSLKPGDPLLLTDQP